MSRPTGPLPAVDKQVLKSLEVPPGAIQSQRGTHFSATHAFGCRFTRLVLDPKWRGRVGEELPQN